MGLPNSRYVRKAIYNLKRQFGMLIQIYRPTTNSVNYKTGQMSEDLQTVTVRKAVIFPNRKHRDFAYDLSFIAANRNFTYGGYYDVSHRKILFDLRDLPSGFVIDIKCRLVFGGKRYEVKEVHNFEHNEAVFVIATWLEGAPQGQEINQSASDTAATGDSAQGVEA
jgi:hypothetical protein